jgi:hypothetical protein
MTLSIILVFSFQPFYIMLRIMIHWIKLSPALTGLLSPKVIETSPGQICLTASNS